MGLAEAVRARPVAFAMGLTIVVFALSQVSSWLLIEPETQAATLWLPSGLVVGVLVTLPPRQWPLPLAAAMLGGAVSDVVALDGGAVLVALGWAVANAIIWTVGALLARIVAGGRVDLRRWRGVVGLGAGAVAGAAVGAAVGAATLALAAEVPWGLAVLVTWLGDVIGILAVAPLAVLLLGPDPGLRSGPDSSATRVAVELTAAGAVVAVASVAVLATPVWPVGFLAYAPVVLVAATLGVPGAAVAGAVLALIVLPAAADGRGLFAGVAAAADAVTLAQVFVLQGLVLAVVVALLATHRSQAEVLVRAALDRSPDPFLRLEPLELDPAAEDRSGRDLRVGYANRAAEALLADDEATLVGRRVDPLLDAALPEGSRTRLGEALDRVVRTGAGFARLEVSGFPAEPAQVWEVSARPLRGGLAVAFRDVSALHDAMGHAAASERQARDALARLSALEERHRTVIETLAEGIVVHAPDGRLTSANPAAREILGLSEDEIATRSVPDERWGAVDADGEPLPSERYPVNEARAQGRAVRGRVMGITRPGGERRWLSVSAAPLPPGADGSPGGVAVVFVDVTDTHRTLEALHDAEQRFRLAFTHAPVGIALVDLDGRILDANDAYGRIAGRPLADLVGGRPADVTHPDDAAEDRARFDELLAGDRDAYVVEKRVLRPDGEVRWVEASVALARDAEGAPSYGIRMAHDVTARRATAELLAHRASHDPLTDLPNRRTVMEHLDGALERAHRQGTHVGVLFVDLDGFKRINDRFGHRAGDELLVRVARQIRRSVRGGDVVGRLGGDEFIVVVESVAEASELRRLSSVLRALAPTVPGHERDGPAVRLSVGVAVSGAGVDDADALLAVADRAMYADKQRRTGAAAPDLEVGRRHG